ncbi:MAG TPA: cellulase family glycosylhydrolase [Gemmatimonadales bacterium]|nr:cellulase family glycosylhydrolase [Gemmatimonadales bacterium]
MTRLRILLMTVLLAGCAAPGGVAPEPARWSEQQANTWYDAQPWLVGSNYVPRSAVNQLEMWQVETFDPAEIEQELAWAEDLGMNTMRVFLHDLLWLQDSVGFRQRIDQFLVIAERHGIRPMFVIFDSVWDPEPQLGPQRSPTPGIHNSGWVQSPGALALSNPSQYLRLKAYVQGVMRAYGQDPRILAWDVWNEPGAENPESYGKTELLDKVDRVKALLPQVFEWARAVHPTQPLTSGVWSVESHRDGRQLDDIRRIQLLESDILTFHNYGDPESFQRQVTWMKQHNRPVICTEFMARPMGSTFALLPMAKEHRVGMINWGFVVGKTQTNLPWDSWQRPYVEKQPEQWFHEVLREDGTPYLQAETDLIRQLTGIRKVARSGAE